MKNTRGNRKQAQTKNPPTQHAPESRPWLLAGVYAAMAVFAAVQSVRMIHAPDAGFHVRIGEWILEHATVPRTEVFSWLAQGRPYVDLYWGYQVLTASIVRLGGFPLLTVANAFLLLAALTIVVLRTWRFHAGGRGILPFLLLPALVGMTFSVRPHVVSCVALGIVLWLLEEYRRAPSRMVLAIPILLALWFNLHPLAVLGIVAVGAHFLGTAWERRSWDRRLALTLFASILAMLATPYGLEGALVPFQQFGFLQEGSLFKGAIAEYGTLLTFTEYMRQNGSHLFPSVLPPHTYLLLAAIGLLGVLRTGDRVAVMVIAAFVAILLLAMKNFDYAVMALTPSAAEGLATLGTDARRRWLRWTWTRPFRTFALGGMMVVLVLASLLSFQDSGTILFGSISRFGTGLDPTALPVRATAFLAARPARGRIMNDLSTGGLLMQTLKTPVFMDGRNEVYGEQLLQEYLSTYQPAGLQRALDRYHPSAVIFNFAKTPQWAGFFARNPAWRLVYADEVNLIYRASTDSSSAPGLTDPAPWQSAGVFSPSRADSLLRRSWPTGPSFALSCLLRRQYYPLAEIVQTATLAQAGFIDGAILAGLTGLERSTVCSSTLYLNLGNLFYFRQDWPRALECYERTSPTDRPAGIDRRIHALQERIPEGTGGGK